MVKVGVVVNPVSGTDVRRINSTAGFMDNMQKARILRGVLAGLEASGVEEVLLMPDFYGIASYALEAYLGDGSGIEVRFLDMTPGGVPEDTVEAIKLMARERVRAIVLLGGDGTVRLAAKACNNIPLMPISTGTNNVIPYRVDGTIAGLAAGAVAMGYSKGSLLRMKRIKIYIEGSYTDHALIDAASTRYPFIASRAILDWRMLKDVVVAHAPLGSIGLASLASSIMPLRPWDERALHLRLGDNGMRVKAVLAPGVIRIINVEEYSVLKLGERVELRDPLTIELDGERGLMVENGSIVEAEVSGDGPLLINLEKALEELSRRFLGDDLGQVERVR